MTWLQYMLIRSQICSQSESSSYMSDVHVQFAHPGEKARRRDPKIHTYDGVACPDMKKVRSGQEQLFGRLRSTVTLAE